MNFHITIIIFHFKNKISCSCIGESIYDPNIFTKIFISRPIKGVVSSSLLKAKQKLQ